METHVGVGVGRYIEKELFSAQKYLLIVSPGISLDIGKKIFEISKKGVNTKILTSEKGGADSEETNRLALELIQEKTKHMDNKLEFLSLDYKIVSKNEAKLIHPKIYVIDGSCAIIGSANLTINGFENFAEYIQIFREKSEISKIEEDFNKLWDQFAYSQ